MSFPTVEVQHVLREQDLQSVLNEGMSWEKCTRYIRLDIYLRLVSANSGCGGRDIDWDPRN